MKPTYKAIQDCVKERSGFSPKTCWIAHVKELSGLPVRKAWSREGERKHPCPAEKVEAIQEAFRELGMMGKE